MGSSPLKLEDLPQLMHNIQSRLPVKEAARTTVLSKSWLYAWSTIPTVEFVVPSEPKRKQLKLAYIDRTLIRYLHDNIPIERFDLEFKHQNQDSASFAEKWIRSVVTKTCLKELFLIINFYGFKLPEEILSGQNLTKIRVSAWVGRMKSSHNPPIVNCVSLQELNLTGVRVSQQLLDHILSSCRLLAKIKLESCSRDLKTIKVKSLPCLNELEMRTNDIGRCPIVEISNVPNLKLFSCILRCRKVHVHLVPSISLGSNVTQLSLGGPGLVTDYASLDMIKSGFPILESLTLYMTRWTLESFHFTCASPIKRFSLLLCPEMLIDIQINALELNFFYLEGMTMPSLSFPISTTLEELTVQLAHVMTFDASFFLNMRGVLELSSKSYVHITTHEPELQFGIDDLKTRLQFPPATNVQILSFNTYDDECLWEVNSPFFDAFFEICHPNIVTAKLKLRGVLKKKMTTTANWPRYLKHIQTITKRHKRWETLSRSYIRSFLSGPGYADFKLKWSYS